MSNTLISVVFYWVTAGRFKERASMILDTHTVFLIHVWTWEEGTKMQTTAEMELCLEHREGGSNSSARVMLWRWTRNKRVLCLTGIDFNLDYIHHVHTMLLWSKEKSLLSRRLRNEIKRALLAFCPLQILSAVVTKLKSAGPSFNVLSQEGQTFLREREAKMAWEHLQYYKCNKTSSIFFFLQICQTYLHGLFCYKITNP